MKLRLIVTGLTFEQQLQLLRGIHANATPDGRWKALEEKLEELINGALGTIHTHQLYALTEHLPETRRTEKV